MVEASYDAVMAGEPVHLVLKLDTDQPIEIGDFVGAFTGLSGQFEKFIKEAHPGLKADAQIFVREVRTGCVEVDLVPALALLAPFIAEMDRILILEEFVRKYGKRIASYFVNGGRDKSANGEDLKDFSRAVSSISRDPDASATLSAAYFEDGERKVRAVFQFDNKQARTAMAEIENHTKERSKDDSDFNPRVVMVFTQTNIKQAQVDKKTQNRVQIEEIMGRDLPLMYGSDLTEERIEYEIREADENIFKKAFVVDVYVQRKGQRPWAYKVTAVHQVLDLPDDD